MNPCMVSIQVPALLSCVCMAANGISAGHRFDECSSDPRDNPARPRKDWMESPVQLIGASSLPNCANKAAAVNESKAALTCWWPSPRRRREALNIHACHSPHAERVSLASSPFHTQTQTYTHSPFNLFPFVLDGFCGSAKKKGKEKRKKAVILYFSTAEIWRIRGGPCSPFSASRTFWYQPISNTHLSPLWFSVCLYALHLSSAQFPLCLVSLPPPASVLILIPSIDPSLLPFFLLSPASYYLSSLSNLSVVSSPPTLLNLSASLPPSFCLHIRSGRTSSFCSSLCLSIFFAAALLHSFSLFPALTLSSSSTRPLYLRPFLCAPLPRSLSPGRLAGVFGSPTGHLSLCSSQLHSLTAPFFKKCFMNGSHQKDTGGTSPRRAKVSLRGTRLLCCA